LNQPQIRADEEYGDRIEEMMMMMVMDHDDDDDDDDDEKMVEPSESLAENRGGTQVEVMRGIRISAPPPQDDDDG
jgi:hypothetical protein